MSYMITTNELYHHGIMGQKWGIRRYQPYPSGHTGGKFIGEDTLFRPADRDGLSNKNRAPKHAMDGGGWATKNKRPKYARYTIGKNKKGLVYNEKKKRYEHEDYLKAHNKKPVKKVHEMSDKELKQRVDRLKNEEKYIYDLEDTTLNRGKKVFKDVMAIVGTVATISAAINKIRKNLPRR